MDRIDHKFRVESDVYDRVFAAGRKRADIGLKIDALEKGEGCLLYFSDWTDKKRLQQVRQSAYRTKSRTGDGRSYKVAPDHVNQAIMVMRVR